MRQAIRTKYLPPTTHRGARIRASCDASTTTIAWDYALNCEANHAAACLALCARLHWDSRTYVGGCEEDEYVWVDAYAGNRYARQYLPAKSGNEGET